MLDGHRAVFSVQYSIDWAGRKTPNTNPQLNGFGASSIPPKQATRRIGIWSLVFLWSLVFGAFSPLGVWSFHTSLYTLCLPLSHPLRNPRAHNQFRTASGSQRRLSFSVFGTRISTECDLI